MSVERHGGLRALLAAEAARLMYQEGVKQYFTAKRLAAKRVLGRAAGRAVRFRPRDLPSNGEIRDALLAVAALAEGAGRLRRLFAMRVVALRAMESLGPFAPRLIGSVSTGHIRAGSDVDLHVFTDDPDALEAHLQTLAWGYETARVCILKFGEVREYLHVHVRDAFPLELTVYPLRDQRFRPRSSTDGRPIERVKPGALRALLAREHPEAWARYLADGTVAGLDEAHLEDPDDAASLAPELDLYEALLGEPPDPAGLVALPGEGDAFDEPYDPLPGFEDA